MDTLGVKDDRIRQRITRPTMFHRLLLRLVWLSILLPITLPGLSLWTPIFVTAAYYGNSIKKTGPIAAVYDEIAQQKLIYGLLSGILVYLTCLAAATPIVIVAAAVIPIWMWMTLRWFEDLVSTFRALKALWRLLRMPTSTLHEMQALREELHDRVYTFALMLGLPDDPEGFFAVDSGRKWGGNAFESATDGEGEDAVDTAQRWFSRDRSQKGRVRGRWDAVTRYVNESPHNLVTGRGEPNPHMTTGISPSSGGGNVIGTRR